MRLLDKIGKGSWKRLTAAALSALLLIPVPALAFVFTQPSWTFVQRQVSAPAVITSFNDFAGGGSLTLNFGLNQPAPNSTNTSAYSVIFASRNMQITSASESVQVTRLFETLLQGASLKSFVSITQVGGSGGRTSITPPRTDRAGIKFARVFAPTNVNNVTLGTGNYTINVKVEYRKNRLGVWDNTPSRPGSPHQFVFRGT